MVFRSVFLDMLTARLENWGFTSVMQLIVCPFMRKHKERETVSALPCVYLPQTDSPQLPTRVLTFASRGQTVLAIYRKTERERTILVRVDRGSLCPTQSLLRNRIQNLCVVCGGINDDSLISMLAVGWVVQSHKKRMAWRTLPCCRSWKRAARRVLQFCRGARGWVHPYRLLYVAVISIWTQLHVNGNNTRFY